MSSLEERKQLLFDDPDISKVEPHRVYCSRCNKWLKLDEVKLYAASVWRCHKNTKSHNSRPHVPSATPSRMSEEDQLSSSTDRKSASDPLSTPLPSGEERSNLRNFTHSRVSIGETSRFRNSDTASVSSSSSTARATSLLNVLTANIMPNNGIEESNSRMVLALKEVPSESNTFTEQEEKRLSLPTPEASQPITEPSNIINQTPEQSSLMDPVKAPPVPRMLSISDKDMQVTMPQTSSPEQVSPQRKASYRALMAEPYVGKLEPYRAFCTLCKMWVNLSSRTPYSYGVWKGHVRKSDKHKILQTSNADDEYNTGSDHSQEEGIATTSRGTFRPSGANFGETAIIAPLVNKHEIPKGESAKKATALQADAVPEGNSLVSKSGPEASLLLNTNMPSGSATLADIPSPEGSNPNEAELLTGEPVDALIRDEASFSKLTPQKQTSLLALQHRRQTMLSDPDAAVVESRKVKCRICDRWIKGSSTQEYSLHHWLKHRKKCIRNNKDAAIKQQFESVDNRRALLEKDPDVKELQTDRAFCNKCDVWVRLSNRCDYSLTNWLSHKKVCPITKAGPEISPAVEEDDVNHLNNAASVSAEMRRLALQMDQSLLELSGNCITCRHCLAIVPLSQSTPFMPEAWIAHKAYCYNENVTDKVKNETIAWSREEVLRADPGTSEVDSYRVRCKCCNIWVDFDAGVPYSLTEWESHRKKCSSYMAMFWPEPKSHNDAMELDVDVHAEEPSRGEDVQINGDSTVTAITQDGVIGPEITIPMNANARHTFLLQQPDILRVEAHRVMCCRCFSWIGFKGQTICATEEWLRHKTDCPGVLEEPLHDYQNPDGQRSKPTYRGRTGTSMRPSRGMPKGKGKGVTIRRAPSPMTLPPLPPRPRWPGEDERKQQFIEDPDVIKIEPHRLLCKICNCWIRLHPIIRYSLGIWPKHKVACKDSQASSPSDARMRAKSEKEDVRRQMLEEDPYVTDMGPHRVTCKACGTSIRLDTTYKYEGSHWRAHRSRCPQIPLADRSTKKRKGDGRKFNFNLHETPESREQIALGHSSDSDSDASSAPRPQPTAFFTVPLEVNLLKMFKQDSRQTDLSMQHTVKLLPFRREAELSQRLHELAMDLDTSNRLNMVIDSSRDVGASFDRQFGQEESNDLESSNDRPGDYQTEVTQGQPLTPNSEESWVPRKRTREEEEEFNAIFERWPKLPSPGPKGKQRVCKLSKEGLKALE